MVGLRTICVFVAIASVSASLLMALLANANYAAFKNDGKISINCGLWKCCIKTRYTAASLYLAQFNGCNSHQKTSQLLQTLEAIKHNNYYFGATPKLPKEATPNLSKIKAAQAFFIIDYVFAVATIGVLVFMILKPEHTIIELFAIGATSANAVLLLTANSLMTDFLSDSEGGSVGWSLVVPWIGLVPALGAVAATSFLKLKSAAKFLPASLPLETKTNDSNKNELSGNPHGNLVC